MTYAVLDTNFFLHFEPIDQVAWLDLLDTGQATLVLPRRIIEELDTQKDQNAKAKLRERARKAQQRIEKILLDGDDSRVRDSVTMEFCEKLADDFFSENDLDRSTPDDHLVATALHLQEEHPESRVVIVTDDTGPRLTAKPYNIEALRPPKELRLPAVQSETKKKLRKLKLENERLKRRIPDLELRFENGKTISKFEVSAPELRSDEEIEEEVDKIREEYPEKEREDSEGNPFGALGQIAVPTEEEIQRYNSELPEYYEKYREYLMELRKHRHLMGRVLELNLVVDNEGTTPAEDIDIRMHFPDGFRLTDSQLEAPAEPNPPRPPQSLGDRMQALQSIANPTPTPHPPAASPSNVSSHDITETNSYQVGVHIRKVKHNMKESLDPLYVVYESYDEVKSFSFDYRINAANIPDPVTGTLNVVVE